MALTTPEAVVVEVETCGQSPKGGFGGAGIR